MSDGHDHDDLATLRALGPPDTSWEPPPADLWDRIARAVADEAGPGEDARDDEGDGAAPDAQEAAGTVVPLGRSSRSARPGAPWWLAAAAAVALAVAGAVVLRAVADDRDDDVVAQAPLDVLAGSGSGSAELLRGDGAYRLRLDTAGLDDIEGYYEVWLLNEGVTGLISLGPLRSDGVYDLPAGIDPADFPIVDVSIEPFDGDPAHSSDSVLRGQLDLPS